MAKPKDTLPTGTPVLYRARVEDLTVTRKTPLGGKAEELHGSIHHPSHSEFAGLVTAAKDGSHEIVIFPPGREPKHLSDIAEGGGAGEIEAAF